MIQQLNRNKFKITIDCGKVNGKRKRISKTFIGNKTEAKRKESELKDEINSNYHFINNRQKTFNDLIEIFINDYAKTNLKKNTIYGYQSLLKVIKKEIGKTSILELNTYLLQKFYNKLKQKYDYTNNTILHYYVLINNILNKCLKWELIKENPNKKIDRPKKENSEKSIYDYNDICELKKALKKYDSLYSVPILLCLDTGLRREEINGLQWRDIDFSKKTIKVERVRISVGKKVLIETPKTANSKREIIISDYSASLLQELKNKQLLLYKNKGLSMKEESFVFINSNCTPLYPDTISKKFAKIIKENNLKKITFHELRHTSTSLLIESNIDINAISRRLGHSCVSTTLNIYTHMLNKTNNEIAEKMNEILSK